MINDLRMIIVCQDLGYTVFSTVCAFYLPCVVMMVIYGKVFQAARARIHKKRFRSQPHNPNEQPQHQQQQPSEVDASLDAGQFVSSASDGIVHAVSPDDVGGDSIVSQSPIDRQVLGTTVTLNIYPCDDDDEDDIDDDIERTSTGADDDEESRTSTGTAADVGPLQPVVRPTRLALSQTDRNGSTVSPSESLETPTRSAHFLTTPLKSSPTASLRGSWLDLTKQFIMDRRKCLSPKSKVCVFPP